MAASKAANPRRMLRGGDSTSGREGSGVAVGSSRLPCYIHIHARFQVAFPNNHTDHSPHRVPLHLQGPVDPCDLGLRSLLFRFGVSGFEVWVRVSVLVSGHGVGAFGLGSGFGFGFRSWCRGFWFRV